MILWIILFLLVISASFVLTKLSMRDFSDVLTEKSGYSLFLVRNISALDKYLLDLISENITKSGGYISFERLFKGKKSTLVVFGPSKILSSYSDKLNLLELEDYTEVNTENILGIELGIKNKEEWESSIKIFENLPNLLESEEVWWQVILSNKSKVQITVIVLSGNSERRAMLVKSIEDLKSEILIKLPKAFSDLQILGNYKLRSFRKDNKNSKLNAEKLLKLISI